MKTFIATYDKYFNYGAFDEFHYVIVAETQQVALGLALEAKSETAADGWKFEEVDTNKPSVHLVHEDSR
ncbi:MAG: hypothetical protein ACYC1K_03465 [Minisyncoccota bacterium]